MSLGAPNVRRIKLKLASVDVEFTDRDKALKQIEEFAEKGTYPVYVVYGPEGCGKTALFRQAKVVLEEYGYTVVYFSPLEQEAGLRLSVSKDVEELLGSAISLVLSETGARFVEKAIELASKLMRYRRRIAILADDIFQAVGLDRAELYVKMLLNLIEYPPVSYEKIVVLVGSSEGVTKRRVGRHRWSSMLGMWNMSREGFKQLYEQLPGTKPPFEEVWAWTSGNPGYLGELYKANWRVEDAVKRLIVERGLRKLIVKLTPLQLKTLEEALEDPDVLVEKLEAAKSRSEKDEIYSLVNQLVELNLIVDDVYYRDEHLWIDQPPPIDKKLGIGREIAWQTPLHREAVRRALEAART